jgi:hypothetical protein
MQLLAMIAYPVYTELPSTVSPPQAKGDGWVDCGGDGWGTCGPSQQVNACVASDSIMTPSYSAGKNTGGF